jgi:glycosyltransferase involved in cell wall biosynthesis
MLPRRPRSRRVDSLERALAAAQARVDALEQRMAAAEAGAEQPRRHAAIDAAERMIAASSDGAGLTVSVVLPTFDRPRELAAAIASVWAQTHPRWELLGIDAGGTAATRAVLDAHAGESRMRVLAAPGASGCQGRNHGLEHATGDVVAYLDDDNQMCPGWLHALAWAAATHTSSGVFHGARVHDGGHPARAHLLFDPATRETLLKRNPVDTNVLGHRRSVAVRWDCTLPAAADWDLVVRLLAAGHESLPVPVRAVLYRSTAPGRTSNLEDAREQYRLMQRRAAELLGP